ncbi:MAG: tRNA uridine-5-carboxymethylaminomethyl(34) synthesis GTPase MnmE [Deltaproteobacteria bacterium]|nr:tRNA uridine-5-carboxymethylaminomethyl(34) synthesis GTPase MnmE [Deltaproteobacteria bacterium]MBW2660791.1 tRNA uridine-5-carboxymethylaminomethyl(34) synthesis GTPase MnmE [Deltaproteobacteria bacterium]
MKSSTIAAIATPIGCGGVGIIKISGPNALSIAAHIFRKPGFKQEKLDVVNNFSFKTHRLYYGHIVDPENGRVLDEVVLAVMKAPGSYTREDVVEIQAHSGYAVLSAILLLVLKQGVRPAEPGEFTKRAYINGRIDLTQAEAVVDIINAKTDQALEIATSQIKGDMKIMVEAIRDVLVNIMTRVNAAIDFSDDVGKTVDVDSAIEVLQSEVVARLKELIEQYDNAHVLRDGVNLVIVGRPNVGKSSLMNSLIKKDRAIVTCVPGTTRDLIEESLNVRGIPVVITDTAGLHKTDDPVEVIGIKKAYEHTSGCDLVLFMVDASCSLTSEDIAIFEKINNKKTILVINKSDLVGEKFAMDIPSDWVGVPHVTISARYKHGIETLKDLVAKIVLSEQGVDIADKIIPNLRHKIALDRSLESVSSAVEGFQADVPFELIAIDIQGSIDSLGEITGVAAKEEILDKIFSRFCIGK